MLKGPLKTLSLKHVLVTSTLPLFGYPISQACPETSCETLNSGHGHRADVCSVWPSGRASPQGTSPAPVGALYTTEVQPTNLGGLVPLPSQALLGCSCASV